MMSLKPFLLDHRGFSWIQTLPRTDPKGAGILMLTLIVFFFFVDGIHGAPYIAAPWIRHGL